MERLTIGFISILLLIGTTSFAQHNFIQIDGIYSQPRSLFTDGNFSDKNGLGIYAKNGGGFQFSAQSVPEIIGISFAYQLNMFGMDKDKLSQQLNASEIEKIGLNSIHNLFIGPVLQIPFLDDQFYWSLKAHGGIRFISLSEFTAYYPAIYSRFTSVEYQIATRATAVYEFATDIQYIFNSSAGIHLGLSYIGGATNKINYHYLTNGSKVIEGDDSIYQTFDYINIKLGLSFKI